jgi:hypothetical protein
MNFTVNGITKFYLNKVRLFRNTSTREITIKITGDRLKNNRDITAQEVALIYKRLHCGIKQKSQL